MDKSSSSAVVTLTGESSLASLAVTLWCLHYECYKHLQVCERCRMRIKCRSYLDYWAPRFDF